jgi:hypothetical protein
VGFLQVDVGGSIFIALKDNSDKYNILSFNIGSPAFANSAQLLLSDKGPLQSFKLIEKMLICLIPTVSDEID